MTGLLLSFSPGTALAIPFSLAGAHRKNKLPPNKLAGASLDIVFTKLVSIISNRRLTAKL
ncbi:hypothetical protein BRO54_0473 [Geobacillus proteiniphilus]|uniref:Uncharacterized protein n=1 Tax=Geobacillus proteiniphilus TaxID=860353 RepID=A0A1Q5T7U7_9BACL|nr:hypothetical protein BRO54_0473 [Geobacillus proteiniphilus]